MSAYLVPDTGPAPASRALDSGPALQMTALRGGGTVSNFAQDVEVHTLRERSNDQVTNASISPSAVISAWYGDQGNRARGMDITPQVIRRLREGHVVRATNEWGDPAWLTRKVLEIVTSKKGAEDTVGGFSVAARGGAPAVGPSISSCWQGHPLSSVKLKLHQGFVHTRKCNLCDTEIQRHTERRRCEQCRLSICAVGRNRDTYNICFACVGCPCSSEQSQ